MAPAQGGRNETAWKAYVKVGMEESEEGHCTMLVDSGADNCLVKLKCIQDDVWLSEAPEDMAELSGIGSTLRTLGKIKECHLKLGNIDVTHPVHVVPDEIQIPCDGILGTDLLGRLDAKLNFGDKCLEIPVCAVSSNSYKSESQEEQEAEEEYRSVETSMDYDQSEEDLSRHERYYCELCKIYLPFQDDMRQEILEHCRGIDHQLEQWKRREEERSKSTLGTDATEELPETDADDEEENGDSGKEMDDDTWKEVNEMINELLGDILIETSHMNEDEKKAIMKLCGEYYDVFWQSDSMKLTHTTTIKHEIPVKPDQEPINQRPYRLPEAQKQIVQEHVENMLSSGIIRESTSPWNAPIVLAPKKSLDGKPKYRFCCDFRKLNEVTKGDAQALPNINEILDQLGGMTYFTTLDLASGYHQVEIQEADKEKTAFSVPSGHYEYNRMAFGLKGAPACFTRLMNEVLRGLIGTSCYVYMDDIICYGRDLSHQIENLRLVFQRLREHTLLLQPEKCSFLKSSTTYLGHIISREGVTPDPSKIEAVENFPTPKTTKDLKSFLGLSGYYRRFIKDFAKIAKPLNSLLKEGTEYIWTEEQEEAFKHIKQILVSEPVLQYPDFTKEFLLITDASQEALGAVLSQGTLGKDDRPVAYASRTLNSAEKNYSTTEKELLAVVWSVKYFRPYLWGRHFKVVSDHRPLRWLMSLKDPGSRLTRWTIKLSEYDFEVIHRPGKANSNADALSRIPIIKVGTTPEEVLRNQEDEDEIREIKRTLEKYEKDSEGYVYYIDKRGRRRLVVPKQNRNDVMSAHHDTPFGGHQGVDRTIELIKDRYYWKNMDLDIEQYIRTCEKCNKKRATNSEKAPVPMQLTTKVIRPFQTVAMDIVGKLPKTHSGNQYILTFQDHFSKYPEAFPIPDQTAETIAKVFVTEIICRHGTPEKLLTDQGTNFISDLMSETCKLLQIDKIQTTAYHPQSNGALERSHQTLVQHLKCFVDSDQKNWDTWLPFVMMSYRSTPQTTTKYSPFYLLHGREMRLPTDWMTEDIQQDLSEDDFVNEIKRRFQIAYKQVIDNTEHRKEQSKRYYDKKAKDKNFKIGDLVLLHAPQVKRGRSKKLMMPWVGPYTVIDICNDVNVMIKKGRNSYKVHKNRLKPFYLRN